MRVQVETYSGFQADERPLRFALGERQYRVEEILDKWYGPDDTWFKVRADDGGLYILRLAGSGSWTLESYRAIPSPPGQAPVPDD
jgi:hypothetical protein